MKKYYLIYQVTNLINGKIYIGKHITNNLEDGYMGSGKLLARAKDKYGIENFKFTILMFLSNEDEMNLLERCVVTPEFCNREDTYNIMEGGSGGWDYVNLSSDYSAGSLRRKNTIIQNNSKTREKRIIGLKKFRKALSLDKERFNEYKRKLSKAKQKWNSYHPGYMSGRNNPMYNHVYTQETINKMSISHTGERNPNAGKIWISNYDLRISISIHPNFLYDYIGVGWVKKRVINWK